MDALVSWPMDGVHEVRAYRLNWKEEQALDSICGRGGSLHRSRLPKQGILLDASQEERLKAAVSGDHPAHSIAACLYPHHAFVFFDASGAVLGCLDVCFLCSNYCASPDRFADIWDLEEIRALIKELGMPIRNPDWPQ